MYKLIWSSDETIVVLVLAALCVSIFVARARFPRRETPDLSQWRRTALRLGLVGNTLSLGLLLGFLLLALLAKYQHPGYLRLLWAIPFLFWISFSLATAVCGTLGRGVSRVLVTANGIALASLWYLLALANSP